MGDIKTHDIGKAYGGNYSSFWGDFCKTHPTQNAIFQTSKIIEIWTLHISVFVNMTNIIVKSYAVQYMCMEVMICQSERSSEILIISQTHTIGGTSKHIRWE